MKRAVELRIPGDGYLQLHLENVTPETGKPTAGYVVNGDWYWSCIDGVEYARDAGGEIRNKWLAREYEVKELEPAKRSEFDDDEVAF